MYGNAFSTYGSCDEYPCSTQRMNNEFKVQNVHVRSWCSGITQGQ